MKSWIHPLGVFMCVFMCVLATLSLKQMSPMVLMAARETQLHILTAHEVIRALICTLLCVPNALFIAISVSLTHSRSHSLSLSLLPFVLDRMLQLLLSLALDLSLYLSLPLSLIAISLSLSIPFFCPKPRSLHLCEQRMEFNEMNEENHMKSIAAQVSRLQVFDT